MPTLFRYISGSVVRTLLFTVVMLAGVFWIGTFYELLRDGYSPRLIAKVIPFAFLYVVPYMAPIAIAAACALAYGRLAADNEVVPLLTGGVHPLTLMWPAFVIGAAATLLSLGLETVVIPYSYYRKKTVQQELFEELAHLPTEKDRIVTDHSNVFIYVRQSSEGHLGGLEMAIMPGALGSLGRAFDARGGRIELYAKEAELRSVPGGLEIALRHGALTIFELGRIDVRSVDRDGDGRLHPAEWAALGQQLTEAVPISYADQDGSGDVDRDELREFLGDLDPTQRKNRAVRRMAFTALDLFLAPEPRARYRIQFRSNPELLRFHDAAVHWRRWVTGDPAAPALARAEAAALATGLALAPGAAPALPLAGAELAIASASPRAVAHARSLEHDSLAVLHERIVLALAPLLFSIVATAVPLLLRHNNRLLPVFVTVATVSVSFFLPYLLGRRLIDDQGLDPTIAYAPAVLLTLGIGIALCWRVARR